MELREMRKRRNLSQKALGRLIGLSQRAISAYESGDRRPSPEVADRIGKIFKLSREQIWEMFYGSEPSGRKG